MRYWILMFRPETYEVARKHGLFGVLSSHQTRFNLIAEGDRFITYISRERLLDGHGIVTSAPYVDDEKIAPKWEFYPIRARARFEAIGCARDAKKALWGLSMCDQPMKTEPTNYLFCMGGFMEIPQHDYEWLRQVMDQGQVAIDERLLIKED
jgi:hypothetical protein